jgi:transposase-like protein
MGKRSGISTSDRDRLKELERENRELKQANEILRKASFFSPRRVRPAAVAAPSQVMVSFIDQQRVEN